MSMNQSVNYPLIYTNLKATSRYTLFIAFCFYFLILCKYFLYITTTLYTSYNASMRYLLSFLFMSNLNFLFIHESLEYTQLYENTYPWKIFSLKAVDVEFFLTRIASLSSPIRYIKSAIHRTQIDKYLYNFKLCYICSYTKIFCFLLNICMYRCIFHSIL